MNAVQFMSLVKVGLNFFPMAQRSVVGQCLLVIEASRPQSDTPQSVGLLWMMVSKTHRPLPDRTQYSQDSESHVLSGIWTHIPSKRVATAARSLGSAVGLNTLRILACFKSNSNFLTSYVVLGIPFGAVFLTVFVKKVLYKTKREEVQQSWRKLDNERLRDLYYAKYY